MRSTLRAATRRFEGAVVPADAVRFDAVEPVAGRTRRARPAWVSKSSVRQQLVRGRQTRLPGADDETVERFAGRWNTSINRRWGAAVPGDLVAQPSTVFSVASSLGSDDGTAGTTGPRLDARSAIMRKRTRVAIAGVVAAVVTAGGASVAFAGGGSDGDGARDDGDVTVEGAKADTATTAALKATDGGTANSVGPTARTAPPGRSR